MPIATFGIFGAIIIPVTFMIDVTLFPALLSYHDQNLTQRICCCQVTKLAYNGKADESAEEV